MGSGLRLRRVAAHAARTVAGWHGFDLWLRRWQGATDHYQVLLDQGAAVPGSPAEARLARLIHDSGEVPLFIPPRCPP